MFWFKSVKSLLITVMYGRIVRKFKITKSCNKINLNKLANLGLEDMLKDARRKIRDYVEKIPKWPQKITTVGDKYNRDLSPICWWVTDADADADAPTCVIHTSERTIVSGTVRAYLIQNCDNLGRYQISSKKSQVWLLLLWHFGILTKVVISPRVTHLYLFI